MSGLDLLLVALGGAIGAVARALIDQAAARAGWLAEYGTLTINLAGSLLAGLIVTLIVERSLPQERPLPERQGVTRRRVSNFPVGQHARASERIAARRSKRHSPRPTLHSRRAGGEGCGLR
ncbi:MAG: fluoride efflux transporter FluC [Candidatus Limnocylindrus sp.]